MMPPQSISVKQKRRGRPATGQDPLVGFRLPPETLRRLDQLAERKGISRSDAIRRLIQAGLLGDRESK
jgi:hypothetical protein